jgi:hypothetical protein
MLKAGSPAIDTGQPGAVPAGLAIRDLAGNPRRAAGTTTTCPDGIRDKGAYEYVGPPCLLQDPTITNGANPMPRVPLESKPGTWTNKPTSFQRKWLRCDVDGEDCVDITGYRQRTGYTPKGADIGHTLRVQVLATNAAGDSEATSAPSGVVAEDLPTNTQLPSIIGGEEPVKRVQLSSDPGQWAGHVDSYLRRWLRCEADGGGCTEITDYSGRKGYTPKAPDVGHTLRVQVKAVNSAGESEPATSDPSGVVSEPPG